MYMYEQNTVLLQKFYLTDKICVYHISYFHVHGNFTRQIKYVYITFHVQKNKSVSWELKNIYISIVQKTEIVDTV
jgi:hypothetical protein